MLMNTVSSVELASIQADASAAACDKACVIQRATSYTLDTQGGKQPNYTAISPDDLLAGMAEPTAGQLTNYGYIIGSKAAWQIKLPVGTDVQENDHLIIAGQTLNVVKILSPRSYQALITLLAAEVK